MKVSSMQCLISRCMHIIGTCMSFYIVHLVALSEGVCVGGHWLVKLPIHHRMDVTSMAQNGISEVMILLTLLSYIGVGMHSTTPCT